MTWDISNYIVVLHNTFQQNKQVTFQNIVKHASINLLAVITLLMVVIDSRIL